MFSNASDHTRPNVTFKTYSDQRLASLYLDDPIDFPIHLLVKVFDVVLDPRFKLEEITLKSFWDIFDYIADFRRRDIYAYSRDAINPVTPSEPRACPVPPLVVSLVVDGMVENRMPLGMLAQEDYWKTAYRSNVTDLHAMSLVHSSWTAVTRSALRTRVVLSYQKINHFLVSPLCGPWITEIVIYWRVDNGYKGATRSDANLFRVLLQHTPRLRSLAFVTSLVWSSMIRPEREAPPLLVSECLELVSSLVPNLENIWLRHIYVKGEGSLTRCRETNLLRRQLPKLRSLKFLSLHLWDPVEQNDMIQHPSLETVEICDEEDSGKTVYHFGVPRSDFNIPELSCSKFALEKLEPSRLSRLKKLHIRDFPAEDPHILQEAFRNCSNLVDLELCITSQWPDLAAGILPASLKCLRLRNQTLSSIVAVELFPRSPHDSLLIKGFCNFIRPLSRLCSLRVSEGRYYIFEDTWDWIKSFSGEGGKEDIHGSLRHPLVELCKERGIEFVVQSSGRTVHVC